MSEQPLSPDDRPAGESANQSQPDMFAQSVEPASPAEVGARRTVPLKSYKSLDRLRDRILLASRELARLRSENADLQRQVDSLRAGGAASVDGTPIILTETPSVLRAKVESFIEAIDQYLEDDLADEIQGRGSID